MDKETTEEFRILLRERAAELINDSSQTVEGMHEQRAVFADPLDRAMLESNRNFQLRLRDRERRLYKKIQEALQRLEAGEFGLCDECGEPIDLDRLRARPVTTLCIDCKEEQERLEKMEL